MPYPIFFRRFISLALCSLLLWLSLLMLWNYTIDTYGIFKEDYSKPRVEINQHFVKMRYLLKNPVHYDAFLFGSSRVGCIDETKLPGNYRYYNMTYSEGLPQEWLQDVRELWAGGVKVKCIILGLDEFSYKTNPAMHHEQVLRVPYTKHPFFYYVKLLTLPPNLEILAAMRRANESGIIFDICGTGRPRAPKHIEEEIENDPEKHIHSDKFRTPMRSIGHRVDETLEELRQMKELSDAMGSEFIVIFNPIYIGTYLAADREEMNDFKRRLSSITAYYDFSGVNKITTDNYNYYEVSHFRLSVGDKIVMRLCAPGESADPDAFGVYVTSGSVNEHLKKLDKDEQAYKVKLEMENKNF